MAKATVEQVKEGLKNLIGKPDFNKDYKNVDNVTTFNKLYAALNKWLDDKDLEATDKFVAQVINYHLLIHFNVGTVKKIGTYSCATLPPLVEAVPLTATYTDLKTSYNVGSADYKKVRAEVTSVLNVDDKTHSSHGSNFKGSQTLEQIITNVCSPIKGDKELARVKGLVLSNYGLKW